MATAKKVEIPQPRFTVELTLSQEEAETLRSIHARIGGDPECSRRKHMTAINKALSEIKVSSNWDDTTGSVWFNDSL